MALDLLNLTNPSGKPGRIFTDTVWFFDDFVATGKGDTNDVSTWDDQSVNGTALVSTTVDGGVMVLTANTATADDAALELNGEPFPISEERDMYFECRFSVGSTTAYPFVGLGLTSFSYNLGASGANHVGFGSRGDGRIIWHAGYGGGVWAGIDTGVDLVPGEFVRVAFLWHHRSQEFRLYVDGALVGVHPYGGPNTATPDLGEPLTLHLQSDGNLAATVVNVDYVFCAKERD